MTETRDDPARILLVDDNPADVDLTRALLEGGPIEVDLSVASDGVEALEFLEARAGQGSLLPHIVLLDLSMPRLSGTAVLETMRKHPVLHALPVIVVSSSTSDDDIAASYARGANSYVPKGTDLSDAQLSMDRLLAFWFATARLPEVRQV